MRLLGEDLVLYRDASGTVGLIEPSCAHRKANLSYGIPEENGIRCAYHGWIFNETGQCVDQPSEPEGSKFKEKVRIKAYKCRSTQASSSPTWGRPRAAAPARGTSSSGRASAEWQST